MEPLFEAEPATELCPQHHCSAPLDRSELHIDGLDLREKIDHVTTAFPAEP